MKQLLLLVLLVFMVAAQVSWSAIPETMSYQGRLTDGSGNAVDDGNYSLTFNIYDVSGGGSALWTETHGAVATVNGIFNAILGSNTPLNIAFDKQYWLGIKVGGGAELTPRIKLTSTAYSLNARSVADGAITGVKVANGHVVRSVNGKTDDVTLAAGTNVSIVESANTITINNNSWGLTGNAGTTSGTHFLGTVDDVPLEFRANGERVLLISHVTHGSGTSYNIIGGYNGNSVGVDVFGATVFGGGYHIFGGDYSNSVTGDYGTVSGGNGNTASGEESTVGGGSGNNATGHSATVGGGGANLASNGSTVGGGSLNYATGYIATVGGGRYNDATGDYATVGGGHINYATAAYATVSGGGPSNPPDGFNTNNMATDNYCTVGGGGNNQAGNDAGTTADATYATVAGGENNTASGHYSTIPGGRNNIAQGYYSFAAGRGARAIHRGSFVWGDARHEVVESDGENQFIVRAIGGTWIYTNSALTAGMKLTAGSSSWAEVSDRAMKRNIRQVDSKEILSKLAQIPISQWSYKAQDPSIEHIGPMAQDFYAAFGLGEDDKHINTLDPDGVALAAIQGLYELVKEKDAENAALRQCIDDLDSRLAALEVLVPSQEGGQK